jgi:hypothetical protein
MNVVDRRPRKDRPVPYDPKYDPLVAPHPGQGQDYAPTYWVATAGPRPAHDGPIASDVDVDVAIIGAGFTGLACAIFLAREHGIKAAVLDVNQVAWGCSSRNGGQAQNASGRLSRSQWIARWGLKTARDMHAEIGEGFATFKQLLADGEIDCDQQPRRAPPYRPPSVRAGDACRGGEGPARAIQL